MAGKDADVLAMVAPEFRGASGSVRGPKRRLRALAVGLVLALLPGAGKAGDLQPWSSPAPPELALTRLDAAALDLADMRGEPVIVHFFATWCGPCIEEMASLNALAQRRDPAVAILAVNVGEVPARLRSFFKARPVDFPVLLDEDRAAMKRWQVLGLPTSFVLDGQLRPAFKTEEPLDWTSPAVLRALAAVAKPGGENPSEERPEEERPKQDLSRTIADKNEGGAIR
ncbi:MULTISPECIES: TlpA disulfide reductase family protein [Bosea]|jgi:thiol-disulfide isomerase/thioredoxin|nr:TlpA disulfide reductase family protein [Bosea spartocytisi]